MTKLSPDERVAVERLFADYAWALDTGDRERFISLFTEDGRIEDLGRRYEGPRRSGPGGFIDEMRAAARFRGKQHWATHTLLTPDGGDRWTARSFAMVTTLHITGATCVDMVGHFRDVLVKDDGRWLFAERVLSRWDEEMLADFPVFDIPSDHAGSEAEA